MIYGLGLPDDVLERIYRRNAEQLFARFKGAKESAVGAIESNTPAGSPMVRQPLTGQMHVNESYESKELETR